MCLKYTLRLKKRLPICCPFDVLVDLFYHTAAWISSDFCHRYVVITAA